MARNTFISYKYSEARNLRDRIIDKLGEDAKYYKGETSESPDLTDSTTESIKENLKDMMFGTSVTIVIISPNMTKSVWIDWEIEYTLKDIKRGVSKSRTNGLVGVVMKYDGGYDWLISYRKHNDGCRTRYMDSAKLYDIIKLNRFNNITDDKYSCKTCKSFDAMLGSYMTIVKEDVFLNNPHKYIENAYDKSQSIEVFKLTRKK